MPQEEQTQKRADLLNKLFDLMAGSKSLASLPAERLETIKTKYRAATDENIIDGIAMLEEEKKKIEEEEEKNRESFMKKVEKRKQLVKMEIAEKARSEELADKLLENLD
jgi:23S rRNA pseudoU1915 N3-methylase RlmH